MSSPPRASLGATQRNVPYWGEAEVRARARDDAIDPKRHFATINFCTAKGSFDLLIGNGEHRRRQCADAAGRLYLSPLIRRTVELKAPPLRGCGRTMRARFLGVAALIAALAMGCESRAGIISPSDFGSNAVVQTFASLSVSPPTAGPLVLRDAAEKIKK